MAKITTNWMELQPAYGRDYKNKKEVEAAFREGKDFMGDYTINFQMCSIRDFEPKAKVLLRYKANSQVASVIV